MRVFKFGGASVRNADGVINLLRILQNYPNEQLVVIVSAMGKTTNALEALLSKAIEEEDYQIDWEQLKEYHLEIGRLLFLPTHHIFETLQKLFKDLYQQLQRVEKQDYDFHYDQIVSYGELLSTHIIHSYLKTQQCESLWLDAREYIKTDTHFRAARVDLKETAKQIQKIDFTENRIVVSQGFVGGSEEGVTTTLGREGSDYSAALFAYSLKTSELVIWKDVEGVYNADPKIFNKPQLISHLSYKEAVELAFYGASIIHPKTIQPLSERGIELKVKSFKDPELQGTCISKYPPQKELSTSVIVKKNQLLLSLIPRDLSFTDLPNMSKALKIIARHRHQVNLIQNSAVSFSVCLDSNVYHFEELLQELKKTFEVRYNTDLVLVTIRNYPDEWVDKIYDQIQLKLEQRNRSTYQVLVDQQEFDRKLHQFIEESFHFNQTLNSQ